LINEGIKCGDYVNVQLTINSHTGVNAGLYLNPNAVQFLGYGPEIINAPSADVIFGTQAPQMPQGASATPLAPAGMIQPQGVPAMQQAPPVMQQQAAPHFGVVPQHLQQAAQPPAFTQQAPQGFPAPQAPVFQQPATPQGFGTPQGAPVPQGFPIPR